MRSRRRTRRARHPIARSAVAAWLTLLAWLAGAAVAHAEPVAFASCLPWGADLAGTGADLIEYRRLDLADFRASAPEDVTPLVPMENAVVAAHVAVSVLCFADLRVRSAQGGDWTASFTKLAFRAVLDRGRSWWNYEVAGDEIWTLRHEQGHFDLAEVMARDLAREAPMIRRGLRGEGDSKGAAVAALSTQWSAVIGRRLEAHRWLQRHYDLDTLHGNDPAIQGRWWQRIFRDLRRTRPPD